MTKRILKAVREKNKACNFITYKGTYIRLAVDPSAEIIKARREWENIFKVMREEKIKCQPRVFYLVMLSFRNDDEILSQVTKV